MGLPPSRGSVCPCSEDIPHCFRRAVATGCFGFAYVGGFATEQEVLARWSVYDEIRARLVACIAVSASAER